jgi:predicted amidohydrolase YtcJ
MSATLVIVNAKILTLNPKQPQAQALAARNGRIIAVGSNAQIRKRVATSTTVIDAKERVVVPGLVDCHVHMTEFGFFLQHLNLRNTRSIKEMQRELSAYASKAHRKGWILGGRWDHEKLAEKRLPTCWDLDAAVPDRPVFLVRVCGHMGVANTEALRKAGITSETVAEGGRICLNDATGQPNGILEENAMDLVRKVIPKPTPETLKEVCLLACTKAVEAGLTGVHWITDSPAEIRTIGKLDSEGRLPLRVHVGVPLRHLGSLVSVDTSKEVVRGKVGTGFIKMFADGSLGSHTAAMKRPYTDEPNSNGLLLHPKTKLRQLVLQAHRSGVQLAVHAIGDRAIEEVLDAYEQALKQYPRKDHRHRIEHCSILTPQLIKRMKRLGLTASVQPYFVVSDFWLVNRVGERRARWAFPFRTLVKTGVVLISGSDCPVEDISPLLGIWAAVAKRGANESLTVKQAFETYTSKAAYASFEENEKGTVEVGKLADLTILSGDPFRVEPNSIRKIKADMTVIDGKVAYTRRASPQRPC